MAKTPAQQKLSEAVARINTQTGFVQPTKTAPLVLDNSAYGVNKKELIPMPTNGNLAKLPSVLPSGFTPAETKDINFISQAQGGPQTTPGNRDSAGGGTYVPPNSKAGPTTFTANSQASSSGSNNSLGKNQTGATTPTLYPTASNPVTTLSKNPSGLQEYNYDDILAKDARGLKDYIDLIQINQQQGYKPTTEELYKVKKASDRLQELNAPVNAPDPYKAQIDAENQARQQREAELKARDENIISTEEARIKATLDQRKAEQDRQGVQVGEQTQSVLSFSGFGRSTYAADKQAEIQQTTNQNKNILTAEAEANKAKYRAQIAGATREELNQYDERINALKDKSAELQITNALQLNQIHQQEGVSYEDKVQNIFELADKNKPEIPLTPQQTQQASSYAKLIIGADGNVDTALMKTIPPELLPEVMRQGAELRGATAEKQKEFSFANIGQGQIAVMNPNTGEVEFQSSGQIVKGTPLEIKRVNGVDGVFNPNTGDFIPSPTQSDPPVTTTKAGVPVSQAISNAINQCKNAAQCGEFVNNVIEQATGVTHGPIKDSYESKVKAINDIGQATSQADVREGSIYTYPVNGSSYGHIGIVTSVQDDGTFTIVDYNYDKKGSKREVGGVRVGDITGKGGVISKPIVTNANVPDSTTQESKPVTAAEQAMFEKGAQYIGAKGGLTEQRFNEIASQQQAEEKAITPEKRAIIQDALVAIEDIETTGGKEGAVGASFQKYLPGWIKPGEGTFVPGTPAANYAAKFNRLRDMLTLPNLDKLKGAMSDKDIQFLRNASTSLSLDMTEAEFDKTLKDIKIRYSNLLGGNTAQQTPTPTQGNTTQEADDEDIALFNKYM